MKQLHLSKYVLNEHYSVWLIDFAISVSFEVPFDRVQSILPPRIYAIETRPGVGMINLAVFNFTSDTYGLTASCAELVASVHIVPNVAAAPMLPRLSMHTFQLAATTQEFINSPFATQNYPVFPEPLRIHIDRERISAKVEDAQGRPVLALAAATGVNPRYEDDRFYVQSVTARGGRTLRAGNLFELRRAENQRNLETAGAPFPHPFFNDLDISDIASKQCCLQMWSEPGTVGKEIHFFLETIDM